MNHIMFKQIADLDHLDHVALPVAEVNRAVAWYRDGTRSVYVEDSEGNAVELMDEMSWMPGQPT